MATTSVCPAMSGERTFASKVLRTCEMRESEGGDATNQ